MTATRTSYPYQQQAKDLQKQFDDIVWECGINDPRIAALAVRDPPLQRA
jgi:hypothetical protein